MSNGTRNRTGIARLLAACMLAALVSVLGSSHALAHAIVVRSDPPNGSVLSVPPREIRLWFSEAISPQLTQARLLNMNGEALPSVQVRTDPADATLLVITAPELTDGVYNVAFVALSAADWHTTQGHLVFRVGGGAADQGGIQTVSLPAISWMEVGLRWLDFISLAGLVGAIAVAFFVLRPSGNADEAAIAALAQARRRVLRWAMWCALVSALVGAARLYWQATELALPPGAGSLAGSATIETVSRLLSQPRFGALWLVRQVIVLAIATLLFALNPRSARNTPDRQTTFGVVLGILGIALLSTQALSGHSAAVSPNAPLAVLVDTLHLTAASFWIGGLLALAVGMLPMALAGRGTPAFAPLAYAGWGSFGGLAAFSVGILIATGLYSTGRQVASVDALITTFYGRTLILKIALVLLVGAFGLINSSLLHPWLSFPLARLLRRAPGWAPLSLKQLPMLVITEIAFGLVVLLVTGTLISSPPARGAEFAGATAPSQVLSQQADDLLITFQAAPNQPGQNIAIIRVASSRRPAPAEIMRVIVRFTFLGQDIGMVSADAQAVSPGLYQLAGEQLSLTGPWKVAVVVRRRGLEDSTANFDWTVAALSPAGRVVISNQPMEATLTWAAIVVLMIVVVGTAGVVWLKRSSRRTRSSTGDSQKSQPTGPFETLDAH